ncbi:selenium metabolism-associated LysR family transcriptional regulator [Aquifex aeolicus]|nr:selenium metabolism-associated LysR family transcriptional regulator [Aquifex aeolicus]
MKDIDLKLIEIFCYVYEYKSVTKASSELNMSQSTISFHMKNLETQLGQKLFYRKGKTLIPTAFADKLYEYATELTNFKRRMLEDITKFSGKNGGVIRIGASSIPGNYLLPQLLGEFIENFKGYVNVELRVSDSQDIYEKVINGDVDLGIIGYLPRTNKVDAIKFYTDRILIVGNPELEDKVYTLEELINLPLVIREVGSGTRSIVEDKLREKGLSLKEMNIVAVCNSNEAVKNTLKYVKGFSFLSSYVVKDDKFLIKLKVKNFDDITRQFYLIRDKKRPLPFLTQELIKFLIKDIYV